MVLATMSHIKSEQKSLTVLIILTHTYQHIIIQAVGDGGQGWGNAVLYIFFSPVIRSRLFKDPFEDCFETIQEKFRGFRERDNHQQTSLYSTEQRKTNSSPLAVATEAMGYKIQEYNDAYLTSTSTGGNSPRVLAKSDKYDLFRPPLTKNPNPINSH